VREQLLKVWAEWKPNWGVGSRRWSGGIWRRGSWGEREEVQNVECRVQNEECGVESSANLLFAPTRLGTIDLPRFYSFLTSLSLGQRMLTE
jgi:hypothetical protein